MAITCSKTRPKVEDLTKAMLDCGMAPDKVEKAIQGYKKTEYGKYLKKVLETEETDYHEIYASDLFKF